MAFPVVAARTETALTTAGTSFTVNFTQTTGDLVLIFLSCVGQGTITLGDSFVNYTNHASRYHTIYKVLAGSEGGNVVVTQVSGKSCAISYNITGYDPTTPIGSGQGWGSVSGLNPDPPLADPGGLNTARDYLWFAVVAEAAVHEQADTDTWATAAPTNFTNLTQKTTGTGGAATTNAMIAGAEFGQNIAQMDPGTFTVAQAITAGQGTTVGVSPVPDVPRVPKFSPYPQLLPQASTRRWWFLDGLWQPHPKGVS